MSKIAFPPTHVHETLVSILLYEYLFYCSMRCIFVGDQSTINNKNTHCSDSSFVNTEKSSWIDIYKLYSDLMAWPWSPLPFFILFSNPHSSAHIIILLHFHSAHISSFLFLHSSLLFVCYVCFFIRLFIQRKKCVSECPPESWPYHRKVRSVYFANRAWDKRKQNDGYKWFTTTTSTSSWPEPKILVAI